MQAAVQNVADPVSSFASAVIAPGQVVVFDSGVGGLSVLRHIMQDVSRSANALSPSLLYVADTAFAPYGERVQSQITDRVLHIVRCLQPYHPKAMVLACNTATAAASLQVRQQFPDVLLVGMEPGLKPGVLASRSHRVGVLATRATLASTRYQALQQRIVKATHADAQFVVQPCDGLAAAIERGELESTATVALVRQYVQGLLTQDVDTVVLGCTHYPFIRPVIERLLAELGRTDITLIETGAAVSRQLCRLMAIPMPEEVAASVLPQSFIAAQSGAGDMAALFKGRITGLTTGQPHDLAQAFQRFLGLDVPCFALPEV